MTLNSGSFCFSLVSNGIVYMDHDAQFMWCWGSNPGLCVYWQALCQSNYSPSPQCMRKQFHLLPTGLKGSKKRHSWLLKYKASHTFEVMVLLIQSVCVWYDLIIEKSMVLEAEAGLPMPGKCWATLKVKKLRSSHLRRQLSSVVSHPGGVHKIANASF